MSWLRLQPDVGDMGLVGDTSSPQGGETVHAAIHSLIQPPTHSLTHSPAGLRHGGGRAWSEAERGREAARGIRTRPAQEPAHHGAGRGACITVLPIQCYKSEGVDFPVIFSCVYHVASAGGVVSCGVPCSRPTNHGAGGGGRAYACVCVMLVIVCGRAAILCLCWRPAEGTTTHDAG